MTPDEITKAFGAISTFLQSFPDAPVLSCGVDWDGAYLMLRAPTAEILCVCGPIRVPASSPRYRETHTTCDGSRVRVTWVVPAGQAAGHTTIAPEAAAAEVGVGAHYAALKIDALFDPNTYDGLSRDRGVA